MSLVDPNTNRPIHGSAQTPLSGEALKKALRDVKKECGLDTLLTAIKHTEEMTGVMLAGAMSHPCPEAFAQLRLLHKASRESLAVLKEIAGEK